ncbi:N-hydroxyarylamine O-acetyltransferase [Lentzea sp. NBRC 105346]|uniref:arylamine N-acetyltransferase family protein n=1 Tax=Lentzea sp. NBRC 105346 TaxID=3032205 RepID=UPI002553121F|nr:arylamine N-acetyltransferase [Lentzea sp. NBRC 105346]GLZ33846.1 N-hydroxyarylamine O-acetyltransferase [Lentzea sp. NBRC 105346]
MDERTMRAYLDRLGIASPERADLDTLRLLHQRHLFTVPFENIYTRIGTPVELDEDVYVDKIVNKRRGGGCYELNGAFRALLESLGYRTTMLGAAPFKPDGVPMFALDHLVLRVDLDHPYLVDVGFGQGYVFPIQMDTDEGQQDPAGTFRVTKAEYGDVDVWFDGKPKYRVEEHPRRWVDFMPSWEWHQDAPESFWNTMDLCSLATPKGRVTLHGNRFLETEDGETTERILHDDELLEVYRTVFGIDLEQTPANQRRTS